MKTCRKCGIEKALIEFPVDRQMSDGRHSHCKQCRQKTHSNYDKSRKGKDRARSYARSEKSKQRSRRFDKTEKGRACDEMYRVNNKDAVRARWKVRNAVKVGALPQINTLTCQLCGGEANHYHHHNGYSTENALNVIPLCADCHLLEHLK